MRRDSIWQAIVVVVTIATIVVNGLSSSLPLNGQTPGEISDRYPTNVVPAGYVFSVWGLIYIGLLAFTIYQALPSQRDRSSLRRVRVFYTISSVANMVWIFLWHYGFLPYSLLAMVTLLLSLIGIYISLGIGRSRAPQAERWAARIPFSVYLGWITVATVANFSAVLYDSPWNGWGIGQVVWAVIILIVAACIAAGVSITRGDIAYVLVIVWAFAGITVKHSGTPAVAITAAVLAVAVALTLVVGVPRLRHRLRGA